MTFMRSGFLVLSVGVGEFSANFLRNAIIARLLSVEDFGTVATFSLLASLLDLAGQVGLDRMMVQAKDADDPRLQATLHTVQLGLGIIAAMLLLIMAWPYAHFMSTPALAASYATLALIPIMRGLTHLDRARLQRQGQFGPWAIRQIIPPVASLLVIYPAYLWLGDYRVALVAIYTQQVMALVASYIGAQWRYTLGFDRDLINRALAFGWPMTANSLLLYFVFNGDRLIVSNQFGLATLGWFSAAVMLTMTPMNFVARTLQTVLLPAMARQQENPIMLQRQYDLTISLLGLVAIGFVSSLALVGGRALVLIFGAKFAPAEPFIILLAMAQGIRLLRAAPALVAMAMAETRNPLYANIVRGIFILVGLAVALRTQSIFALIVVSIIGEILSTGFAGWFVHRKLGLYARHLYIVLASSMMASILLFAVVRMQWPIWSILPAVLIILLPTARALPQIMRLLGRAA
ncbi:Polysaccharide biosynthesis protein [Sphingobium yanoikuyae]|uniref:Polysaccharide biosynthesis protein n=2 Tax=Sphingobium yanoikuyae TaxID=13690 RepID=A0A084EBG7_SPHYA|nr:Polysaccharide biosynthesis protein [Sphingobium yanoikuyae]